MNRLIGGLIRAFNIGVAGYIIFSLLAAAIIFGAWCFAWTFLSSLSN